MHKSYLMVFDMAWSHFPRNTTVPATFSEAIAGSSVTTTRFTVTPAGGAAIAGISGTATDAEGHALTYRWTQVFGPDVTGGAGFLTGQSPTFTAPATAELRIRNSDLRDDVP